MNPSKIKLMKKQSTILLFIILLIGSVSAQAQNRIAKDVPVKEFAKLIQSGKGVLLDVRTPAEVAKGSIKGSVNMNIFDDDFEARIDKMDKSKPVYVYCAAGGRSSEAMEMMKKKGFTEIYKIGRAHV